MHGYAQNQVWCEIVRLACDLLTWMQIWPLAVRRWEPKRLRLPIFVVAKRLVPRDRRLRLRWAAHWPWTAQSTAAVIRLHAPALS